MPDRVCPFVMEGCFSFGEVGVKESLLEQLTRRFYPLPPPVPYLVFSISGRKCYFSLTSRYAATRFSLA